MSAAVVIMRQNQILRSLSDARAVSPDAARRLNEIGLRESWILRRLEARGVVHALPDGRRWLDVAAAQAFVKMRRRRMLIALAIGALVLAAIMIF